MYRDSQLCADNEAYANMLIDSLKATKQQLTVQGGVYASDSVTQVWDEQVELSAIKDIMSLRLHK
jgi:hypothetical protein